MAKIQVKFIYFLKSLLSCVFCQGFSSVFQEGRWAKRKQGVSDLTSYLALAVIWQGSRSGSKAEDEQCFFEPIQHWENIYTEGCCKIV